MSSIGKTVLWVLLLGLMVYVGRCMYFEPDVIRGDIAPDFMGVSPSGDTFHLSDFKDRYVLLDFWASWCAPCRKKNPELVELYRQFKDKSFRDAEGFTIISYALESERSAWLNAIRKDDLEWRWHAVSLDRFDASVADTFGVRQIPTTFFIQPGMEVAGVNLSVGELRDRLEKKQIN